jgi:SAM-dependent methyltransferase
MFIRQPRTDFAALYDADYYAGRGADPTVDYVSEMQDRHTVRTYEWRGVLRAVDELTPVQAGTRWLDYGCGLGGLVRWVREHRGCEISGFDEGYAAQSLAEARIPHLSRADLDAQAGTYDVVTAIEVLEHAVDPNAMLREIGAMLKPGGVLFLTTGNAAPFRDRLARWSYASVPDVHVSYFEPSVLAFALVRAGFEPFTPGFQPGTDDIIRYKVLKQLRVRRRNVVERVLPWHLVGRVVDRRYRITAMPFGRREAR